VGRLTFETSGKKGSGLLLLDPPVIKRKRYWTGKKKEGILKKRRTFRTTALQKSRKTRKRFRVSEVALGNSFLGGVRDKNQPPMKGEGGGDELALSTPYHSEPRQIAKTEKAKKGL